MTEPRPLKDGFTAAARRWTAFAGLVALYLLPAALCVLILLMVAARQEGANAFRYVGF